MKEFIKYFALSIIAFAFMFTVVYSLADWLQLKITFVASMAALIISTTALVKITLDK
ncbi:hypothetical protein ACLIBH_07485 [Virgibacillus sp. W0430]|uniref:hypothetical protein n=1 Tax=Virgibacillus sp. W0430 TaxID=3391580 RepID=UPI003F469156